MLQNFTEKYTLINYYNAVGFFRQKAVLEKMDQMVTFLKIMNVLERLASNDHRSLVNSTKRAVRKEKCFGS